MPAQLFDFLTQLRDNNNRVWFGEHKERFDELRRQWLDEVDRTIALGTAVWPELGRAKANDCVYRIYRDTRFSPDKTPYKTYFSALIAPGGRKDMRACFYVHAGLEDDDCGIFAGIWCPEADVLRKLRRAIADNDDEFLDIARSLDANPAIDPRWLGNAVKTAPKGWSKDHPMIQYLRLKDIGRIAPLDRRAIEDGTWPEIAAARMADMMPLVNFINYSIDEEI